MDKNTPLQSFEDVSDPDMVAPRLALLRAELKRRGLTGFVVPRADEHQGEYVPPRARRLAWLTAFTGSAGVAVVLERKAAIFVDGRYTLQVRAQTATSLFEPHDFPAEGPEKWIETNAAGAWIGYDPWLHTPAMLERLKKSAKKAGAKLVACATNPIDTVWADQPEAPSAPAVVHPFALSGEE